MPDPNQQGPMSWADLLNQFGGGAGGAGGSQGPSAGGHRGGQVLAAQHHSGKEHPGEKIRRAHRRAAGHGAGKMPGACDRRAGL